MKNVSITTLSSLLSYSQIPTLLKTQDIAEPEPIMYFRRLNQSVAKLTNYTWLKNPWHNCLRNNDQTKVNNEYKQGFAVCTCKINVRNDTLKTY